ncbi:hypothetical protein ACFX2J_003350 [Malus domestica]
MVFSSVVGEKSSSDGMAEMELLFVDQRRSLGAAEVDALTGSVIMGFVALPQQPATKEFQMEAGILHGLPVPFSMANLLVTNFCSGSTP